MLQGKQVQLTFDSFELEVPGVSQDCTYDNVRIYDRFTSEEENAGYHGTSVHTHTIGHYLYTIQVLRIRAAAADYFRRQRNGRRIPVRSFSRWRRISSEIRGARY